MGGGSEKKRNNDCYLLKDFAREQSELLQALNVQHVQRGLLGQLQVGGWSGRDCFAEPEI
jgi:hypothetical protein